VSQGARSNQAEVLVPLDQSGSEKLPNGLSY
jgi:hypothetical protein